MKRDKAFSVRDILHGYIEVEKEDAPLLSSPFIQRLRYIRQNDLGFLVFPTLNTSRFEHSLGVMHLAGQLADSALSNAESRDGKEYEEYLQLLWDQVPVIHRNSDRFSSGNLRASFRRAARWYGLLHDVGHLPFSHLTEHTVTDVFKGRGIALVRQLYPEALASGFTKLHEAAGFKIAKSIKELLSKEDAQAAWMTEQLMTNKDNAVNSILAPLKDILDSEIDADRIDSTARDGKLSGGDFGNYDIPRLIRNACLIKLDNGGWRILFSTRAIGPIEGLLLERYKTHRWIHFHPKVLALKNAFRYCISELEWGPEKWSQDNYYIPSSGFFDDSTVLRALWGVKPKDSSNAESLLAARNAVLLRNETASPLWKRTEEFHELCDEVVEKNKEWQRDNHDSPKLNELSRKDVESVERRLNENPPSGTHFLISHLKLKPVELLRGGADDKSACYVTDDSRNVTPLSQQSGLVANLSNIISREPTISVCVLGDIQGKERKNEVREHFVKVARELLREKSKSSS